MCVNYFIYIVCCFNFSAFYVSCVFVYNQNDHICDWISREMHPVKYKPKPDFERKYQTEIEIRIVRNAAMILIIGVEQSVTFDKVCFEDRWWVGVCVFCLYLYIEK